MKTHKATLLTDLTHRVHGSDDEVSDIALVQDKMLRRENVALDGADDQLALPDQETPTAKTFFSRPLLSEKVNSTYLLLDSWNSLASASKTTVSGFWEGLGAADHISLALAKSFMLAVRREWSGKDPRPALLYRKKQPRQ